MNTYSPIMVLAPGSGAIYIVKLGYGKYEAKAKVSEVKNEDLNMMQKILLKSSLIGSNFCNDCRDSLKPLQVAARGCNV